MVQEIKTNDVFYFHTYSQRGVKETISLRQGEQGEIRKEDVDGTETALYRLELDSISDMPIPCDNYNGIKSRMGSPTVGWNTVFYESFDIMSDYYNGIASCEDVADYIRSACKFNVTTEKSRITEQLGILYEYMSRANTRNAVECNMQAAEDFYLSTGMKSDAKNHFSNRKGGIYYDAKFYHDCAGMQGFIQQTIDEIAHKYDACVPDYAKLDNGSRFPDGGITYNGVWNQKTYELIHYHGMEGLEFMARDYVPPKSLVYCETDFHIENKNVLPKIKEYFKGKMPTGKYHRLLIEIEKHGTEAGCHRGARRKIHSYLENEGIPISKTADRMWMLDYFGLVYI